MKVFRVRSLELGVDCYAVAESAAKARYQAVKVYRPHYGHWCRNLFKFFDVYDCSPRAEPIYYRRLRPGLYDHHELVWRV